MKTMIAMLLAAVLLQGCSMVNHHRVQGKMVRQQVLLRGTPEQKELVAAGMDARRAIRLAPMASGGEVNGAMIKFSVFDMPGYFETFAEAPGSSVGALLLDAAAITAGIVALKDDDDGFGGGGGGISGNNNTVNNYNSTTTVTDSPGSVTQSGQGSGYQKGDTLNE